MVDGMRIFADGWHADTTKAYELLNQRIGAVRPLAEGGCVAGAGHFDKLAIRHTPCRRCVGCPCWEN